MKTYPVSAILALLLAFTGHQATAAIPSCALQCIADAVASSTSCGATDLKCQCTDANKAAVQGASTTCVVGACGATALDVLAAANADCAAINASTTPTSASTSTSTPSPSSPPATLSTSSTSLTITSTTSSRTSSSSSLVPPAPSSTAGSGAAPPAVGAGSLLFVAGLAALVVGAL
ncbi:hypothetical protein LZ554_006319 [Drepanopeziza brunnea f. sp. 'monogermtubi']|nr:hypothetical protein LZ554_006319 [Drepanopeziza brunnea f. sp. 'monogermtubi']